MSSIINPYTFAILGPPANYPGLAGWWKADSFSLSDGDVIGGAGRPWVDQSGSGNNMIDYVFGAGPVYKTNIFGSLPAIRSASQYLQFTNTITLSGAFTAVCVGTFTGNTELLSNPLVNMQLRILRLGANVLSYYAGVGELISSVLANPAASIGMKAWSRDGSNNVTFRENKTARGGASDAGVLALNSLGFSTTGQNIAGDIAEICVWNQQVSDADLDILYDTYFNRWGLP